MVSAQGVSARGVSAREGVSAQGVSARGCLSRGVSAREGCLPGGGAVCLRGVHLPRGQNNRLL